MPSPKENALPGLQNLKHIVVLMMSGRSFDHMLGSLKAANPLIDGLDGTESNPDAEGKPVLVQPTAEYQSQLDPSPDTHFPAVDLQIFGGEVGPSPVANMQGFVKSYYNQHHNLDSSQKVMYYFANERTPVLTSLASQFAVFNRWFSSVPGPRRCNRIFSHYGTSFGQVTNDEFHAGKQYLSIYHRLLTSGRTAKYFNFDDVSTSPEDAELMQQSPIIFATFQDFLNACRQNQLAPSQPRPLAQVAGGPSTHVVRDRWTIDDSMGHYPYAYGIYRFLTDPETAPPLAISIQAPWGGGKTSLMRMIQSQLDPDAIEELDQTKARHANEYGSASVKHILTEIDDASNPPAVRTAGPLFAKASAQSAAQSVQPTIPPTEKPGERRVTVWFNAWKYESTAQVWAGLADCIVQQIGKRLGPVDRELFWFRLQLRRLDAEKIRRILSPDPEKTPAYGCFHRRPGPLLPGKNCSCCRSNQSLSRW